MLFLATACESEEHKATRLHLELLGAEVDNTAASRAEDSAKQALARVHDSAWMADSTFTDTAYSRLLDESVEAGAKLEVAQRNLNAFMAGH